MEHPKPKKSDRESENRKRKIDLVSYRMVQSALAIDRDHDQCVVCKFVLGADTPRADVHHVYGRGRVAGDWREQYTSLMCVCKKHHPLPIQTPGGNEELAWVEAVRAQANDTPINKKFEHRVV